jgi:hypothetical protein
MKFISITFSSSSSFFRFKLLQNWERYPLDGINSVNNYNNNYTIIKINLNYLFSHFIVDIGNNSYQK